MTKTHEAELKRKVVQISLALYEGAGLVALCDDGTMWMNERPYDTRGETTHCNWREIRDIPQDKAGETI